MGFACSQNFPCYSLQSLLSMILLHPHRRFWFCLLQNSLLGNRDSKSLPLVLPTPIDLFASIMCTNSMHKHASSVFQMQLHKFLRDGITTSLDLLVVILLMTSLSVNTSASALYCLCKNKTSNKTKNETSDCLNFKDSGAPLAVWSETLEMDDKNFIH